MNTSRTALHKRHHHLTPRQRWEICDALNTDVLMTCESFIAAKKVLAAKYGVAVGVIQKSYENTMTARLHRMALRARQQAHHE